MSYAEKVLNPNEHIVYNRKLHWVIYLYPAIFFVLSFGKLIDLVASDADDGHIFIFFLIAITCFALLIVASIRRSTTEIVVTDKRILFKKGLIVRKTMEMNMNKVETVDIDQSILGRILNYGTVYVRGAGSTYEPLKNIDNPIELRNAILVK